MERCGDLAARPAGGEIVVGGRNESRSVDRAVLYTTFVRRGLDFAGELLELDCGLARVAHPLAHAQQRRHGVEEPPHPRRERRVHAEALPHESPALEWDRPPGPLEVGGRRPPWLSDRRLTAG